MKVAIMVLALAAVAAAKPKTKFEWEYFELKTLPKYVNNAKPRVTIREKVTKEVKIPYKEHYKLPVTEFEYWGQISADGFSADSIIPKDAPCANHYVRDCNDKCAPAYWIGNGLCDNGGKFENYDTNKDGKFAAGEFMKKGMNSAQANHKAGMSYMRVLEGNVKYNFNCPQFWNDGGDCENKHVQSHNGFRSRMARLGVKVKAMFSLQSVEDSTAGMSVVAMAVMAAVAAVAMVAKRSRYESL
jgi:hypothetical protein